MSADPKQRQLKIIAATFEQLRRQIRAIAEIDQALADKELSGKIDSACTEVNAVAELAAKKLYLNFGDTEEVRL